MMAVFLFNLFVMLYAMFFFFVGGLAILRAMLVYLSLSSADKQNIFRVGLFVSKVTIKGTFVIGIV